MAGCGKQNSSLSAAHQGYLYQDILGAYFIAKELAHGKGTTQFLFDYKKTPKGIPDKFDDLAIYYEHETIYIQVKYSNDENLHILTKDDFSSSSAYDLALFDLFATWKALHTPGCLWRICLAWEAPLHEDPILPLLVQLPTSQSLLPGTTCYQIDCDILWPVNGEVLSSWRALRKHSQSIDREKFKEFLDSLVIEIQCPKSTFLQDYSQGLEKLLAKEIESIGIGVYPNDHLSVHQVAESLCTNAMRCRATNDSEPISCDKFAKDVNIIQSHGEIEQKFIIDEHVLIKTQNRIDQVVSALEQHRLVVLTAEPGAGKTWLIENLQNHLKDTTMIVKHYCYTALEDPLALKRITVNVLYASLITQILQNDVDMGQCLTKRYASNLEELNLLLGKIKRKTLLVVDGIDHIWRVYQRNRGGITEDETKILQALAKLDYSNPNISILVISQPIIQLSESLPLFHICDLIPLHESFVEELLEKHSIPNISIEENSLAHVIHEKGNGNALYCKYLIDYALVNKTKVSIDWIAALPPYDYNLTSYYQYLYAQIPKGISVPYALCGADFSITKTELQEITHIGNQVSKQITLLTPILRYEPSVGYSIYHESFKRFVIEAIKKDGASINPLIYVPLISWLQTKSFYKSTKAYGHLLKLYFEVEAYDDIAKTISKDFIEESLFHAQPYHAILQNHNLQKASLPYVNNFLPMIIIAEQTKIIYELEDNLTDKLLVDYLKSIQMIHGDDAMSRVLWNEGHLLIKSKDALRFLVNQAYRGEKVVHWSLVPIPSSIPFDELGLYGIELLHTQQFGKFDEFIRIIYETQEYEDAFYPILDELEWWSIHVGSDWINNTKYFQSILSGLKPSYSSLEQAVSNIMSNKKFADGEGWLQLIRDIVLLSKTANKTECDTAIKNLSQSNWFHNWIIYLIKITELSSRKYREVEIFDAFTYLVRDLDPFKGNPRACDLFKQLPFIKKSFHQGLLLCKGDAILLTKCCNLLEKVADLTTSIQRSYSGPLTYDEYLEILSLYLPGKYVIDKYEEHYKSLASTRVYTDVAEIAFGYAYILSREGRSVEAENKYREGVQALAAYGFRKDRTFSEVLDCSVPFQNRYGTLSVEWFYELYHMSMAVVTHTDGRSTKSYPIEWFKEFIRVYPDEALRFLISKTFENEKANWYQEDEFLFILENYASLFSPTHWFLLCRTLPLASSEKIVEYGFSIADQIDDNLEDVYSRWLQSRPFCEQPERRSEYSQEVKALFEEKYQISIDSGNKLDKKDEGLNSILSSPSQFQAISMDDALAFFEINRFHESHVLDIQRFFTSLTDWNARKAILRQIARSFRHGRNDCIGEWLECVFQLESQEWLYFNICLFVFVPDGWMCGLHYIHYLNRAFENNPAETIELLKEVLGYYLSDGGYTRSVTSNLIKALSEISVDEKIVQELIQTIFRIVEQQLPHSPSSDINQSIYNGLEDFCRNEVVVALLIARLKTLTTEKTQGIIWSIIYIAQTDPESLMKPYFWAFSHQKFLLPIHRVVLLQIIKDYVDQSLIKEMFIGELLNNYPTGFFLEDQYIRSLVGYRLTLDLNSAKCIHLAPNSFDVGFPSYIHPKYRTIERLLGPLEGFFNSFTFRRDIISKDYNSYYMRPENVITPIVPLANATYEIINNQFYGDLVDFANYYDSSYCCDLDVWLSEIVLQVGSLGRRPVNFPTPSGFSKCKQKSILHPYSYQGWVLLSLREQELLRKSSEMAQRCESLFVLCQVESPILRPGFGQYLK